MEITLTSRIAAGDALLDTDLRGLAILQGPWGQLLCAATGQNGGLTAWSIAANGAATLSDRLYYRVSGTEIGPIDAIRLGGDSFLALGFQPPELTVRQDQSSVTYDIDAQPAAH